MKFTAHDVLELRKALLAAGKANIDAFVIHNGIVSGLNERLNGVIFSQISMALDPELQLGIARLGELEKRLSLFGDDVLIEGEVNDAKKVRRLTIRGKNGKVEFRCTDPKLITYPKTNADTVNCVVTFSKAEVALLSKGVKTIGGDFVTFQVKRDGAVHIESSDTNNDSFEMDLEKTAEFVDEEASFVFPYEAGAKGVLLQLMDHMARDNDEVSLVFAKSGNITLKVYGHDVIAAPKIKTGD